MDWSSFCIGFWHPFGEHGDKDESRDDILARKEREIINTGGWTLWSFQYRKLDRWAEQIRIAGVPVYVICSDSTAARNPKGAIRHVTHYRESGCSEWQQLPDTISIPHPFGKSKHASGFKVKRIIRLATSERCLPLSVEWFNATDGLWRSGYTGRKGSSRQAIPTRGEFLIRVQAESPCKLREAYAILELESPYVVTLQ